MLLRIHLRILNIIPGINSLRTPYGGSRDVTWAPPKESDSRFYCYSQETNLTEQLSMEEHRETTEEKEVAKTGLYSMNELLILGIKAHSRRV